MIRWMIPVLLLGACTTAPADVAKAPSPPMVSVFTVAHEDDWQLFMMPDAFRALDEPQQKAVFIHLTAGDAGKGVTGGPVPYYLAREEGALRAVHFIGNAHAERGAEGEPGLGAAMTASDPVVAGYKVHRVSYRNAVAYFLRLADGYGEGTGYQSTGFESLQRLVEGKIATMTAVDKSTTYQGWDDLQATLRGLIAAERVSGSGLSIRITEPDAAPDPIGHSDHRHTAMTMLKAAEAYPCAAVLR